MITQTATTVVICETMEEYTALQQYLISLGITATFSLSEKKATIVSESQLVIKD